MWHVALWIVGVVVGLVAVVGIVGLLIVLTHAPGSNPRD